MIPSLGLSVRLGLGFGLVLSVVALLVGLGIGQQARVQAAEARLVADIGPTLDAVHRIERSFFRTSMAFRSYLFRRESRHLRDMEVARAEGSMAFAELKELTTNTRGVYRIAELESLLGSYEKHVDGLREGIDNGASVDELAELEHELIEVRTSLTVFLGELVEIVERASQRGLADLRARHRDSSHSSVVLGLVALLAGLVAMVWVIRPVQRQTRELVAAAQALAEGDHQPARCLADGDHPATADELATVGRAFGAMSLELELREKRLAAQARLSRALADCHEVETIAFGALSALAESIGCQSGAMYLFDEARSQLVLTVSYSAPGALPRLDVGEGLPGQAATSGRPVIVRDLPEDGPYRLRVGLTDLPARTVAAVPIEGLGVMVLASVRELSDGAFAFAGEACKQIAVRLENALSAAEVARLAADLRRTNEDLEDRNAELQAQGEEIQAQNEELQAQSEEIVAQNEELQRQQQELLAADQLKDEFLSVASHEFKSPIAALKSFCQLLVRRVRGRPEYAELQPMLDRIDCQADKVVVRVNRLLDVSRAKMGTLTPAPERIDLVALLRGLVAGAQVRNDRHRLLLDAPVEQLIGRWDRLYLEQAIGNLIDNAARYSPDGGEIRVEVREENGEAVVEVRDHGIGISPDIRERIFQPYYRGESGRQVAADGMGIGLFIAREMVGLHGGNISVESRPGEGSTFRVSLPIATPIPTTSAA